MEAQAPQVEHIATHAEFEAQLLALIGRSQHELQAFDPDFAVFQLGRSDVDAALRTFLAGGGRLSLAMHDPAQILAHQPRFLRLIKDYAHRVDCRQTPATLHHLTDSFLIGDGQHVLRRYHCAQMRGEASFADIQATETPAERFAEIWAESTPALHATTLGL
ncbi:hypothetical protein [Massilia sp. TS11]|uniref:DUF7931 domain-containing protein n=1 Tax=Massilia sp. TS11 TaxID=2908003 RepID=UPI001EDB90E0|nr:hypothetical protein [Massilia sp. TS11]MCG2582968.1 hypothetical protein [Massilia sp. TS11]